MMAEEHELYLSRLILNPAVEKCVGIWATATNCIAPFSGRCRRLRITGQRRVSVSVCCIALRLTNDSKSSRCWCSLFSSPIGADCHLTTCCSLMKKTRHASPSMRRTLDWVPGNV